MKNTIIIFVMMFGFGLLGGTAFASTLHQKQMLLKSEFEITQSCHPKQKKAPLPKGGLAALSIREKNTQMHFVNSATYTQQLMAGTIQLEPGKTTIKTTTKDYTMLFSDTGGRSAMQNCESFAAEFSKARESVNRQELMECRQGLAQLTQGIQGLPQVYSGTAAKQVQSLQETAAALESRIKAENAK